MSDRLLDQTQLTDADLVDAYAYNDRFTEAHELLAEKGVSDMAHQMVEAHGQRMSMAAAIAGCEPFKESIYGTVDALEAVGVDDPELVRRGLTKALERQVSKAPETVKPEAEKK